jgi:hypothetical protein
MFMMMYFSFFNENLEIRFKMPECRTVQHSINAGLSSIQSMPDCPASNQSSTGMKKNNGTGADPVPD